jgi:hypothetical protein
MKKLTCYQINNEAPRIVPGRSERAWMDATRQRHAYRCLPLTIANSMGWELLCPQEVTAAWNGGPELDDMKIMGADGANVEGFAQSHFGHGVLTFQTSYLFRTEPGTALWARGIPNLPKDGIAALEGITETDWLNLTFTMNWMFTRPGRVTFAKEEPFCFITPIGYHGLDDIVPEIVQIEDDQEAHKAFESYGDLRRQFTQALMDREPEAVKQGWQKWYMRGEHPSGESGNPTHVSKLRLATPRIAEGGPAAKKAE